MVQHIVDNFGECKFINCGTSMATGDKQQPISVKKSALRDLPNETRNAILKSSGNPPLQKERAPVPDSTKVSNIPKQHTSFHESPARPQPLGSNGINGHLVYVRRKLETDGGKINNNCSDSRKHEPESLPINDSISGSPAMKKSRNDISQPKLQSDLARETSASPLQIPVKVSAASLNTSCPVSIHPNSGEMSINRLPVPTSNCSGVPTGFLINSEPQRMPPTVRVQPETQKIPTRIPFQSETQMPRDQHWKERFGRLQMFLKACDQSNQEEYIHKLRSLSAPGRSRHAYELERRAIQLTLEEAQELQRVRLLNVLGKSWPDRYVSDSAQIRSPTEVVREEPKGSELS